MRMVMVLGEEFFGMFSSRGLVSNLEEISDFSEDEELDDKDEDDKIDVS
jgi:hypothetical protein